MEQHEIVLLGGQGNCRLLWSCLSHQHTVAHVKEARDTPPTSAAKNAIRRVRLVTNGPRIGIASMSVATQTRRWLAAARNPARLARKTRPLPGTSQAAQAQGQTGDRPLESEVIVLESSG